MSNENLEKLVAKENLYGPKNILIFLVWVVKYEPGISWQFSWDSSVKAFWLPAL